MSTPATRAARSSYDTINLQIAVGDKQIPVSFKIEDIPIISESTQKIFTDVFIPYLPIEDSTDLMRFPQQKEIVLLSESIEKLRRSQEISKSSNKWCIASITSLVALIGLSILLAPTVATLSIALSSTIVSIIVLFGAGALHNSIAFLIEVVKNRNLVRREKKDVDEQRRKLELNHEIAIHLIQSPAHYIKLLKLSQEDLDQRIPWHKATQYYQVDEIYSAYSEMVNSLQHMTQFYKDIAAQLEAPLKAQTRNRCL